MKQIYVIRHCEAEGQPPDAPLTVRGLRQAMDLTAFFSGIKIDRILSSTYKRAVQSIEQLAEKLSIEVEMDPRLTERVLSSKNLSDWFEKLRVTFDDLDLSFEGGESSREAMGRIAEVVNEVFDREEENTIVVTHGNLLSLLLKHFNHDFGFEDWQNLSNPDVFLITKGGHNVTYERLWSRA